MDVLLQKHEAKHIYKVPEGLRELCTDISREVLRSQPTDLHTFVAEYVDTLLITRENTKIAVKVVNNILLESQAILSILYRTGFSLEQIAVAAPRIQKAFREYLDAIDVQPVQICEDHTCEERSMVSIRSILEATGSTRKDAQHAATVIQAAFRGHYERMALNEAQGKIQWQRAVTNTLDILKKAGATQAEISKAAKHIKVFAYRGYYARRNQKMGILIFIFLADADEELDRKDERTLEPTEAIQAVAWMEMMYKDSGLTMERANDAASVIQGAYRRYRARRDSYDVQRLESTKSMVVEAILDTLRHRVFEKVTSRDDIPKEHGTREELIATSTKLRMAFKEHVRVSRISKEAHLEPGGMDEGEESLEEESEEDEEETLTTERSPTSDYPPLESEAKSEMEDTEEQLTEAETDEQIASEAEVTTENLPTSPEVQSEAEAEAEAEMETEAEAEDPMELELEDEAEGQAAKENEEHQHEMAAEEEEEENVAQETGPAGDAAE
ncbi:uncharacterized protein LOC143367235 [Andrena cerasifolii]|uniref:uncharacterized protein LOC143367235 n=1 Tax=Andrena cerasifolii TaxID=2819439 RepID=UPI004038077B